MRHSVSRASIALFTVLACTSALAHTNSIGYENAGPGAVTFWYGNWHNGTNFTEGSLRVEGISNSFLSETAFSLLTASKPAGLIDGTTNFYSNGTQLVGTNGGQSVYTWQGATITGLTVGDYRFTYLPIANPTQDWEPMDGVILSSTVSLSSAVVGSSFEDNATNAANPMAQMLDGLYGNASTPMQTELDNLKSLSDSEQAGILKKMAPNTSQAATQSATQTVSGVLDTVSTRMESLRAGDNQSSLSASLSQGQRVQLADNSADLGRLFALDAGENKAIWTKIYGGYGEQDAKDGFAGYRSKTAGFAAGADTRLENDWIIGGALTYAVTDVKMHDFRQGDGADIDSYQVTGYATRDFGQWYLESSLAYARQNYETNRDTGITGIARGDFSGNQYAARSMIGVPLEAAHGWIITPLVGAELIHLTQEAYTETGAGVFNTAYDDNDATRVRSFAGPRIGREFERDGMKIRPSVHALWWHDFRNDGVDTTASFSGGGASFTTAGQELNRDMVNIGAALSLTEDEDFTLTLQADSEYAEGYEAYSGQLMGRWRF